MAELAHTTRLRLVGSDAPPEESSRGAIRRRRAEVARENLASTNQPAIGATDPRWVLAAQAEAAMDGSRISPERRKRLMRAARGLGVRVFDASLIIAIVQDSARRGGTLGDAADTIALLAPQSRHRRPGVLRWVAAIGCAMTANALLIWWLLG